MPYVIVLDMTGVTYTWYEMDKARIKNQKRMHKRAYADFRGSRREGVLN